MKYVSLDIETTGIGPEGIQVLEIGMVLDDTNQPDVPLEDLPKFHAEISHKTIIGEPIGVAINAKLIEKIARRTDADIIFKPEEVALHTGCWLNDHLKSGKKMTIAGKNVGYFDMTRLEALIPYWKLHIQYEHRFLDPGSMYFDPTSDHKVPGLQECLDRAGIEHTVNHNALDDCFAVIKVLRYAFGPNMGGVRRA